VRPAFDLTDAELRVLQAMCRYDHTDEMAGALHISEDTVQTHISALRRQFGVHSRDPLIVEAFRCVVLSLEAQGEGREERARCGQGKA